MCAKTTSSSFSYKFALSCFFGGSGCDYVPGLRGVVFIVMYMISYIGGGLLLRYAEGATYLAVVNVREHTICSDNNSLST